MVLGVGLGCWLSYRGPVTFLPVPSELLLVISESCSHFFAL